MKDEECSNRIENEEEKNIYLQDNYSEQSQGIGSSNMQLTAWQSGVPEHDSVCRQVPSIRSHMLFEEAQESAHQHGKRKLPAYAWGTKLKVEISGVA